MATRHICTVLLIITLAGTASCGPSPRATPTQTVKTARAALKEHHWGVLYDLFHPRLRAKRIPRWRRALKNLLKDNPGTTDVSPRQVEKMTSRQIFRTFLEILSRTPKFQRMLHQYETASYTIKRPKQGVARVTFSSNLPLPHDTVVLTRDAGTWVVTRLR